MNDVINRYKDCMEMVFEKKYGIDKSVSRQWIKEFNFDYILNETDNFAMHDDPEEWVDIIYEYNTFN